MILSLLIAAAAVLASAADASTTAAECTHPPYRVYKVSSSPLILYLEGFLTPGERTHLLNATASRFRRSVVAGSDGAAQQSTIRTSQSTDLDHHADSVAACIARRALDLQGFDARDAQLEPLQLVRYAAGEEYDVHTDWLADGAYATAPNGGNRATSFFVYVHVAAGTTGGGTNFPLVPAPRDGRWCARGFAECDAPYASGLTFRPVAGNAVFWENLVGGGGEGDARTEHAGLPLTSGDKVGMNIWTRQLPLSQEARRRDVPLDF
ncbi:hypothetical protein B0T24DRAFT_703467 [Lasiosphaeria ovina]|uniref:Prolyl 4-hydroxylase alpha subunit domain-containing protein n=1 Tax=Lasiosphaeria ovina TaxID=92902 RepID=A0AAE0KCV4_9PEZI|nr:hypothetical protein B0T24DRAFT_703467 [Lasiosphaeria ovina]